MDVRGRNSGAEASQSAPKPVESDETWLFGRAQTVDSEYGESEYAVDRDRDVHELYAAHYLKMVRLAVLLVDDPHTAQDVTQEAFVSLYRRFDDLDDVGAAVGYLRSCVLNGARSVLRRRRLSRRHVELAPPPVATAEEQVLLADEHREVVAALRTLPRRQREVIVLRYWAGLSEAETASALGVSVGSIKSSASRGRSAMHSVLTGEQK